MAGPIRRRFARYMAAAWGAPLRPRSPGGPGGASGSMEDADGIMVHSEGMAQNGMVEGFIRLSGGAVFADADLFDGIPSLRRSFGRQRSRSIRSQPRLGEMRVGRLG